jgi:hypothetical protein
MRSSSSGSLLTDAPQKSMAPIAKKAVPIQIEMVALFSEMIGVGFTAK